MLLAELVAKGAVTDDFSQGTSVVELGNFFSEDTKGGGWSHEEGSEPPGKRLGRVFDVVRRAEEQFRDMRGFSLHLVLAKPSHTSVVELFDPFGEDSGLIGTWDIERGSPPHIVLVSLGAFGVLDLVVLDTLLQGLDLNA